MKQFILLCGLLFLTACSQPFFITTEETITISLPDWPPEDDCKNEYPDISGWVLKTGSAQIISSDFISSGSSTVTFTITKNEPFCATLTPIIKTKTEDSYNSEYFMPAGYIYPYSNTIHGSIFTWEQGYLANVMLKLFNSKNETGVSPEHINSFVSGFNWKKAIETIEKKINNNENFYNPWLIDTPRLLENLCYGNFSATYLNTTNCYIMDLEILFPEKDFCVLSPFIPENNRLKNTQQICIKKDTPTLLSDCKIFGVIITAQSAKKISKETVYLPIYITEI